MAKNLTLIVVNNADRRVSVYNADTQGRGFHTVDRRYTDAALDLIDSIADDPTTTTHLKAK